MKFIEILLQWSIYLSVAINAIVVYLNINKMWSRKQEPVVADSISVAAQLISFVTIIPFLINYSLKGNYGDALYQFLWFVYTGFLIITGIGFWVKEHRYLGIWQKLIRAVNQDKNEVGNLVKSIISFPENHQIVAILHRLAWLDDELDQREREYLHLFTNQLGIDSELILDGKPPEEGIDKFNTLHQLVQDYLAIQPPTEQVQLLGDLVQALIAADEKITPEEEVIAEEIGGMVDNSAKRNQTTYYGIVIHPKNQEQETEIVRAIPEAKAECLLGDRAFVAGIFHTRRYAELVSESYRDRGWFTVVHEHDFSHINSTERDTGNAAYEKALSA
ncbi:hypothetical protein [Allocoleopsis sp.]|uniref:hypothetical protein n=1 Tax=Allocoleopsis sp. TaxID=3088169 RepID=UPI002FD63231